MIIMEPSPFHLPLEKAKIASGAGPPFIVLGKAYSAVFQYLKNIFLCNAIFFEWIGRIDIVFGRYVAVAILICSYGNITDSFIISYKLLKRDNLQLLSAP